MGSEEPILLDTLGEKMIDGASRLLEADRDA
jgi:hypothetical protein